MKIIPVPVRDDNYAYLVIDDKLDAGSAAFVDPYDLAKVDQAAHHAGVHKVFGNLTTHHHYDHAGGNKAFAKKHAHATVWGGSDEVEGVTEIVKDGDAFPLQPGSSITVKALATPCHTQDSICYFLEDAKDTTTPDGAPRRAVFTGDTLFISGCGRFFEGDANQMLSALTKVSHLPDDTIIYNGHEYTASNAKFSAAVLPTRPEVVKLAQDIRSGRNGSVYTGLYTIADERLHNPFLLTSDAEVQAAMKTVGDPVATMAALRQAKNSGRLMAQI